MGPICDDTQFSYKLIIFFLYLINIISYILTRWISSMISIFFELTKDINKLKNNKFYIS